MGGGRGTASNLRAPLAPHRVARAGGAEAGPTDGAVLSVPALAAFALAVLARAVLGAARVAGPLTAGGAGPALFTATGAPHAHSVRAAVHRTDFCIEQRKQSRREG